MLLEQCPELVGAAFTITPRHFLPRGSEPYPGDWHVLRSELGFTDGVNPTNEDPDHWTWTMYRSEDELDWAVKMKPEE